MKDGFRKSILFGESHIKFEVDIYKNFGLTDEEIKPLLEFHENLKRCIERRERTLKWIYKQIEEEKKEGEGINENTTGN
ncbi:MAG: hypothetical protein A2X59_04420 [Nitrospirae bacterium GWC2_42_7]|nr:MAG: hypothetical protein A2X59_04420 [Nitrospirae bacterium GWC2_42_7]